MKTLFPLLSIAVLSSPAYGSEQRADHVCKEYYTLLNTIADIFVQAQEGKITADEAAKTSTPLIEKAVELCDLMWKLAEPDGPTSQRKDKTQYDYLISYMNTEEARAQLSVLRKKGKKVRPYAKACENAAFLTALQKFAKAIAR